MPRSDQLDDRSIIQEASGACGDLGTFELRDCSLGGLRSGVHGQQILAVAHDHF